MRRTICFALFGLLVSSGAAFPQARSGRGPWARPRRTVVVVGWAARPAVFLRYGTCCPFPYPVPYLVPYPVWNFIAPSPAYVFAGTISESHPQLVFKDGTTYTVTDYWRIDDQLHFITIEEAGTQSLPPILSFAHLHVHPTLDHAQPPGL